MNYCNSEFHAGKGGDSAKAVREVDYQVNYYNK